MGGGAEAIFAGGGLGGLGKADAVKAGGVALVEGGVACSLGCGRGGWGGGASGFSVAARFWGTS